MDVDRLGASDCDAFVDGWLGQPVSTVSSLAFVVAAVVVLRADRSPTRLAAAAALVVIGVGSVAFHGPQPGWAGPVHDAGVLLVPSAVLVHLLAGRRRLDRRRLAVAAGVLAFARDGSGARHRRCPPAEFGRSLRSGTWCCRFASAPLSRRRFVVRAETGSRSGPNLVDDR